MGAITMYRWCQFPWLVILALFTTSLVWAEEADDPEGLKEPDPKPDPDYHLFVGRWTSCKDHPLRIQKGNNNETLTHTPQLGVQRREVQCRAKNGDVVEPMYCGALVRDVGTMRVCIVRQDCVTGDWSAWRPRHGDNGLVRSRQIRQLTQAEGRPCGLVEEVKPMRPVAGAHWIPEPWGACKVASHFLTSIHTSVEPDLDVNSYDDKDLMLADYEDDVPSQEDVFAASCGGGLQRREVTCADAEGRLLQPVLCANVQVPTIVQPCEVPCPRDCEVGEWGEWTPCQPNDGCPLFPVQELTSTGYSVRHRRVTAAASGGGAPCPPLEEKRACSTPRCASWLPMKWGPCVLLQHHKLCGRGKRTRELRCVGHDGKDAETAWCSGSSAPARSERCRIACAGDCVVSPWSEWSPCSAPCASVARAPPTRLRRRHVLAQASPTGWACPTEEQLIQYDVCNTHACATYSWLTTPWGECLVNRASVGLPSNYTEVLAGDVMLESDAEEPCVEEGEMNRDVMCVQNNADVVRDSFCTPLHRPTSRRACTVRCHRGCRVEAWGPWSPCLNTCERRKQIRVRNVHGGADCGAGQQSRDCPVPRSCRENRPRWHPADWTTCRLLPGNKCGDGYRTRSIWCGSESHRVDAGLCAGLPVPRAAVPCTVGCGVDTPLTCDVICDDPLQYMDSYNPDIPTCTCKNVSLQILPSTSDCILRSGSKCGRGHVLREARCILDGTHVPMAVCRKYHPLPGSTGGDMAINGYTYSEEFPDLIEGECTVGCSRDCMAGPWGEWGPCVNEAGSLAAFRFRTREVLLEGTPGGRECGATLQRATCAVSEPRWLPGEWSVCAPKRNGCGRTLTNRTITCVNAEGMELKETACTGAGAPPARKATCRAPCPDDCVLSEWSDWSPCEQTKWGGRRDRTRVVLRAAGPGGAACGQLVEAGPCSAHAYTWHQAPWDDCQPLGGSPCGEGIKRRSVRCLRSDGVFVNDSLCPNITNIEPRESWCYVPCGVDCELAQWSSWDRSSCTCGDSSPKHMRRIRQQVVGSVWPGRTCGELEQKAPCPREPCMKLVSREAIKCVVQKTSVIEPEVPEACGWGSTTFVNRCEVTARTGRIRSVSLDPVRCPSILPGYVIYSPQHLQEEQCEVECGCSDRAITSAGPWSEWGVCHRGTRVRTRKLRLVSSGACRVSFKHVSIEWMNCTDGEDIPSPLDLDTREDKPREAWVEHDVYHDGYIEGSGSLLAAVWTASLVLFLYGVYLCRRCTNRCMHNKKMKSVAKV